MLRYEARKGPIYSNASLLDENGEVLARVSRKKAQWYLDKGLAEEVYNEPLTVKLTFKTKGRGNEGDRYLLSDKENKCVVCGSTEELTTHHIVPRIFRKNMPDEVKGRNPADIVPVCIGCHIKYEAQADKLKNKLATDYNISNRFPQISSNKNLNRGVGFAYALLEHLDRLPVKRRNYMIRFIKEEFGLEKLTPKLLREIASKPRKRIKETEREFGRQVMDKVEDVQEFFEMWRQHFIDTTKPKFMPEGYDIKRKVIRDGK